MYKYLLLFLLLAGCMSHPYDGKQFEATVQRLESSMTKTIPVKSGSLAVVVWGDDTLAVLDEDANIITPKCLTKEELLRVIINEKPLVDYRTYSQYWQAVSFEDTKLGDYDYNDLVIHVRNICDRPYGKDYIEQSITIQPIALGSTLNISLGLILSDFTEHIVSTNVREDLFGGMKGFINTAGDSVRFKLDKEVIHKYKLPKQNTPWIAWFIEVAGRRLYAISSEIPNKAYAMLNTEGLPYGLVRYSTFSYPKESVSMFDAYPQFSSWIDGDSNDIGMGIKEHLFNSRKLWDWQDIK